MELAVIGDEDLVNGMRLAGITRCHLVTEERGVRDALTKLIESREPEIAIVVILEELVPYVKDILDGLRELRKLVPVVLPVPSRAGSRQGDARAYYRNYIRSFIGFDIEV